MTGIFKNTLLAAVLVAIGQSAVLFYIIESRASILRNGYEIVLKTEPVDPRDLMRGDFVTLNYSLSRLDPVVIKGPPPQYSGRNRVYIALVPGEGGQSTFSRASWQPLEGLKPEEVLLVGTTPDYFLPASSSQVPLTFGIERYYVPEGEGKPLEQGVVEQSVEIVAAVNDKGDAQIKSIRLKGQTLYDEPLY
jgi:uncharacterized membrane-anchored protein